MLKTRIVEAQVFVTDLALAKRFYNDVLGFRLTSETKSYLIYDAGFEFVVMAGASKKKLALDSYGKSAGTVLCLEVADIHVAYGWLNSQGVKILSPMTQTKQGKWVAFSDPDGNLFELIQR